MRMSRMVKGSNANANRARQSPSSATRQRLIIDYGVSP